MEGVRSFWLVNSVYNDVREFHFSSNDISFVVYFRAEEPIFVLDNTCDIVSPNNLLIIEALPEEKGEKNPKTKWDSILKTKFHIDPIKIRPKENTKYKKLDISYSDLSLYKDFVSLQTDELLDSIKEKREILSLDNAYERESENLLNYNKSTQTIDKATVTLENLKKKILHFSKRLKKQNEIEENFPEKADAQLKAELVQKMYDNTEKLKRTERRIKRAKKRSANAFENLSLNRIQIQEIKKLIESRNASKSDNTNRILARFDYHDSVSSPVLDEQKNLKNQEVENRKTEKLTIQNINAKNETGEKIGTTLPTKETIMVKDTEKNLKTTTEFKPPFVDDTAQDAPKTPDVKFAKKTDVLDDKYKKVWMYVASIMVSLIIVFGLFFFLSGDSENAYNENAYIEQNYQEEVLPEPTPEPVEEVKFEEEVVEPTPEPVVEPAPEPVVEPTPEPVVEPIQEDVKPAPVVVAPKPVAKPTPKKVAPKPIVKPAPKKVDPKPVVEEEVVVEDELANIPEEDDEDFIEDEIDEEEPETVVIESVEIEENDDVEEDEDETSELSALQIAKTEYVNNVLAGDNYLTLLAYLKDNFFTLEDDAKIAELEKMNHYWNDFRNATYDAYYESDYTLKSDINYEEYANDEYLLRVYTNAYYAFYEYIVNEFVMKYEYANSTATALYAAIENELDVLGRPLAKLEVLARVYNAIQAQGGAAAVLSAIAEKDEAETIVADNMEIEASLIPLTATTEIVYQESIYSDDDTEIVNQDSTEIVTDFTKEYAESENVVVLPAEEVSEVEENEVAELNSSDENDDETEDVAIVDEDSDDVAAVTTESIEEDEELANIPEEDDEDFIEDEIDEEEDSSEIATVTTDDVEEDDEDEDVDTVATTMPADLEVVMEDDSEEIVSIVPTENEEELILSSDEDVEDDTSNDEEYYAEEDDEDISDEDEGVEYTSEEEIVVEEEV
ncbi:MAG: hypothetical protein J6J27_02075 [Alphaproteobacteria bacterium]|nr:hypothetical protein [Alphaproteobacteria bacterium]